MSLKSLRPRDQLEGWLVRGVDGDTVNCLIKIGWGVSIETAVRIMRIDSWELIGADAQLARNAAARITEAFGMTLVTLQPRGGGKDCFGRIRADVQTRDGDLASWLVTSGLAWWRPRGLPPIELRHPTPIG